jgi:hypothetical protein
VIIDYPTSFPKPLIDGFNIKVDPGLIRTVHGAGYARQRQLYTWQPEIYNFTFAVESKNLSNWQDWANEFGYEWFKIDFMTHESSKTQTEKHCTTHTVRFIGNITIASLNREQYVEIAVLGELAPRAPS